MRTLDFARLGLAARGPGGAGPLGLLRELGRPHPDDRVRVARDRAVDEQQVPARVDPRHADVAGRAVGVAVPAPHPGPLDPLARVAAGADRAAVPEELVGPVGAAVDLEMVPLGNAGRAPPAGGPDPVDALARLEDVHPDVLAHFVARGLLGADTALPEHRLRRDAGLLEVPETRLAHVLSARSEE